MRLMVSDLKGLVLLAYPLVTFGGMLQLNSLYNLSRVATAAIPTPTNMHLFMGAMVYPLFLTAFFRIRGENPIFQASTVIFISAIAGLVVFPTLAILSALAVPGATATWWFNAVVLLIDLVLAFAFLFKLSETDLHKIPRSLIFGSLICLELAALIYVMWHYEVIQHGAAWVAATAKGLFK